MGRALLGVFELGILSLHRERVIRFISEQGIEHAIIGYRNFVILQDYAILFHYEIRKARLFFQVNYIKPSTPEKDRFDLISELTLGYLGDKGKC